MPDEIDRAQHEEERQLSLALAKRSAPGPAPTGRCLYCDELLGDVERWCGAGCRDDWQKERSALLRNAPVGKGDPQP